MATRVNSLVDQGAKSNGANRGDQTHEQRVGLREDFERIKHFFSEEFDRDGAHGVAVFCAGLDNVWEALPLSEPVPDEIKVGRDLYLAPLVPLVGRGEGAVVAHVGGSWACSTGCAPGSSRRSPTSRRNSRASTTRVAGRRRGTSATSTSSPRTT